MRRSPIRSNIRPKMSSMPRQQSEAAAFLDIYKLVVEQKRLKQELISIEQRREQITKRLSVIQTQVTNLENQAQQLRSSDETSPAQPSSQPHKSRHASEQTSGSFNTITLEY